MEQLRCVGLLEGLLQGHEWGHLQGRRTMLVEQLRTKFGGVDEQVLCRLQVAELEDFKWYAQRILTAATLDEVLRVGSEAADEVGMADECPARCTHVNVGLRFVGARRCTSTGVRARFCKSFAVWPLWRRFCSFATDVEQREVEEVEASQTGNPARARSEAS